MLDIGHLSPESCILLRNTIADICFLVLNSGCVGGIVTAPPGGEPPKKRNAKFLSFVVASSLTRGLEFVIIMIFKNFSR
ncbi:hypothetical protein HKBW3S44_00842 [Candidatus Hakubella thermalkaliphila]|uniref:Uncharacterized protein n=1 Tax=Candidatus Hakubella thermalkaliphila TaxID=2754717 RepID=A0A6V8Q2W8_9ACTN|nr:hypothetical protein HKBW3S44_00842 [Candidatus Hakubella thermalkaliphila]GFP39129.1 hypothetical protein HKBW3S47_00829 [Candidatus Hakubella thermalkaliphila]